MTRWWHRESDDCSDDCTSIFKYDIKNNTAYKSVKADVFDLLSKPERRRLFKVLAKELDYELID